MTDEQPTSRRAAREAANAGRRKPVSSKKSTPPPVADAAVDEAPRGGIFAVFAKHPRAWMAGAGAVVFLLLGTGAVFAGVSVGSQAAPVPTATPTPDPPRPVPDGELAASRLRTCSVAGLAADPILMTLQGQVQRADTGEVLFDRAGDTPARTASTLKILTAAAAVAVLGPDYRIRTTVYQGSAPGSIVLVGRGDATLHDPSAGGTVYPGTASIADLAAQTLANYDGPPITSVVLDANYWSPADKWDASWKRSEQTRGYHSEVTALQVDGDRANPAAQDSPRSTDPIARAGQAFLNALRAADTEDELDEAVTISSGSAITTQPVLGEVASAPVRDLVRYMLLVSDNTLAEMLARITSKESSLNGSAASLQQAIPSALTEYGITSTPGLVIRDGSGLSDLNAVPPSTLNALLRAMLAGGANLDVVQAGLPVAGQSGTLSGRFTGPNAEARGAVAAKTGWIDTSYSLSGYLTAQDGTLLVFTFYAIGDGIQSAARGSLDTLTTGVWRCGDNLSNN